MIQAAHFPAFFQVGLRPFFLGAALWAPISLLLWLAALAGAVDLPTALPPLAWHSHELVFGYAGAVVAGFLLTAVPNWTARPPLAGRPLLGLWLLWLGARLTTLTGAATGPWLAVGLDAGFWLLLVTATGRKVAASRNWCNLPVGGLAGLLGIACLLSQAEALGATSGPLGRRLGLAVLLVLIRLIGGRVVPAFTLNWLGKRGHAMPPAPFGALDRVAVGLLIAAAAAWTALPDASATTLFLIGAGGGILARLARWRGWATGAEPLVTILHLGYAWLGVGLVLLGLGTLLPESIGRLATLHTVTAGAIGTMTLAIMTRATLGHTGRALAADRATVAIYALVQAGAALRVLSPVLPLDQQTALGAAGLAWGGAFLLFAVRYGPMLLRPRVPGPG